VVLINSVGVGVATHIVLANRLTSVFAVALHLHVLIAGQSVFDTLSVLGLFTKEGLAPE
jgi:hypothetical protein